MNHFNQKSLTFYGGAIAAVVALFSVVTAYGETNLKAPAKVDGRYHITTSSLPECLKPNSQMLVVQQSGIYLRGTFLPINDRANAETLEKKPSLSGRWHDRTLQLSGQVLPSELGSTETSLCSQKSALTVHLQGTVTGETLKGSLALVSPQTQIDFTAQRQAPDPSPKSH